MSTKKTFAFIIYLSLILATPTEVKAIEYGGQIDNGDVGESEQVFYGTPQNDQRSPLSQEAWEGIRRAVFGPTSFTIEYESSKNYIDEPPLHAGYAIDREPVMHFNIADTPTFPTAARPEEVPFVVNTPPVSVPVTAAVADPVGVHPFESEAAVGGCSLGTSNNTLFSILNFVFVLAPILLLGALRRMLISQEELTSWFVGLKDIRF